MSVKDNLKFIEKNRQLAYSIVLVVLIPLIIIINTVVFVKEFKKNIDVILYDKVISVGSAINAAIFDLLPIQEKTQETIERVAQINNDISLLKVLVKDGEEFKITASLDKGEVNKKINNSQYYLTLQENQPIAFLDKHVNPKTGGIERFWNITMPLESSNKDIKAILLMNISLEAMDAISQNVLIKSFVILFIAVLIVVLLLASNLKLFQYANLYQKIKEVDQMKDEFISMASHELKTPMTVIGGYTSLILGGKLGEINDQIKDSLKMIENSSSRLNALVEDLLDVSRLEQGRLKIELAPTNIEPIIKDILKELKIKADEKSLILNFNSTANGALVNIDVARMKQILVNLIGNAIKYTLKGSVDVSLEAKNNDKSLEIKIKDTGIGMSAKDRERLFEKFYRVQNEKTASIPGTGLGLWITKEIIVKMNGTIAIDSIENVGTQISVNFPIIK